MRYSLPPACSITFLTEQVKALVQQMADAFPGGSVLVFDAANRTAVKMIEKTWLKSAKIKDVGAYFAVSDAKVSFPVGQPFAGHEPRLYAGLQRSPGPIRQRFFFRFLAKVGDGMMKMQIVKMLEAGNGERRRM